MKKEEVLLKKLLLCCCLLSFIFFIFLNISRLTNDYNRYGAPLLQLGNRTYPTSTTRQKVCKLKAFDPWDSRVLRYLNPAQDPLKNCNITLQKLTRLENGTLTLVNETDGQCFYRCLKIKGETSYNTDPWTEMQFNETYYLNCDFVETHCTNSTNNVTYRYIHHQVMQNRMRLYQKEDSLHPSVFIFIFESTSSSSLTRSLVQTNQVLRQYYDATTFYYHNKVGLNSRPNAFAIFTGQRVIELNEFEFPGKKQTDLPNSCQVGATKNVSVIYQFLDQNYVSMIVEDWATAFSYPHCKGYGKVIVDHYTVPMVHRMNEDDIKPFFRRKECQLPFHKFLDYGQKFFDTYNGFAKFAMIFVTDLSHMNVNGLYFTDKLLAEFFRRNVENLKNSFIFLMGDHGLRHTYFRDTKPGEYEDNNPALSVAVPQFLRDNDQLRANLRRNARTHTSQYDIYATLYDIARLAPSTSYQKWDVHDFRKEFGEVRGARGTSIFRPIDHVRTCVEMEIPGEYCICLEEWRNMTVTDLMVLKAGKVLIAAVNELLKSRNLGDMCATLRFVQVLKAEKLVDEPILRILARAKPSNGKYEARLHIEDGENTFRLASAISRRDTIGKQGHCTEDLIGRYLCYCKAPPPTTTTATTTTTTTTEKSGNNKTIETTILSKTTLASNVAS